MFLCFIFTSSVSLAAVVTVDADVTGGSPVDLLLCYTFQLLPKGCGPSAK